jgi:hypothetical protein
MRSWIRLGNARSKTYIRDHIPYQHTTQQPTTKAERHTSAGAHTLLLLTLLGINGLLPIPLLGVPPVLLLLRVSAVLLLGITAVLLLLLRVLLVPLLLRIPSVLLRRLVVFPR